jgi:hypothetical protein
MMMNPVAAKKPILRMWLIENFLCKVDVVDLDNKEI